LIKEFRSKGSDKPILKSAYIDTAVFIGDNQLETLAAIKSKNELIGEIIGLLQSPAKNVIGALQSSGGKLAGIVKTLSERPEELISASIPILNKLKSLILKQQISWQI